MTDVDMGTKVEAETRLVEAWQHWCKFQGAFMDTAKGHKARETQEREARNQVANAAALLAWHINEERNA